MTDTERLICDDIDTGLIEGLTCALVQAPSENPGGSEAAATGVLIEAATGLGLIAETDEVAPGRPNVTVTWLPPAATGPGLMFLGHSDVVPAGPNWTGDPYRVRRAVDDAGRTLLVGRGTTDMKGGLAAVLAAMDVLRRHDVPLTGPVRLVCTVDEEEHGLGVRRFVTRPPDHTFLGCVVAEPTDLTIVRGCRGASYIDIEVTGRAAHSGRPADGRSAINAAARIIGLLSDDQDRLAADPDDLLGFGTWNVGTVHGGQGISVVAPMCSLGVDRRLMPGESAEQIAEEVRRRITETGIDCDGIDVAVTVTMEMPGFVTDANHPLIDTARSAITAQDRAPSVGGWTAACDGGFISRDLGIPAVVLGPGNINTQAHQPDESVVVDDLLIAARVYTLMALRMLG
ncbi:M20 family metallopeptidase [Gordonia sp. (in: high G+C Gram-positive bacteria)]|uniref:M20 family metallopeptidase n=1 Tax=Gordonia sp. (in: high G+C Gram-positive bacteria) TaxID=84139 RepID=UPI0025C61334|nr:M20 family metallopeptidase [Gordonia sp. (in: high G+C Gram-positive bacteria)]HMS74252.1 M20 family metallopeptidase [Gordonia sp. (in: high G+C Gram-positive bacteria)]